VDGVDGQEAQGVDRGVVDVGGDDRAGVAMASGLLDRGSHERAWVIGSSFLAGEMNRFSSFRPARGGCPGGQPGWEAGSSGRLRDPRAAMVSDASQMLTFMPPTNRRSCGQNATNCQNATNWVWQATRLLSLGPATRA